MTRARLSDVHQLRATFKAVATCEWEDKSNFDLVTRERCHWKFTPLAWEKDADCRRAAKTHVAENPGHDVVVEVRDVTRYYLPDTLVAELTAETKPAGRNVRATAQLESKED